MTALDRLHSIADLRRAAARRLPPPIFHYMDGGAEDEVTQRRNSDSFDAARLAPRVLIDVSQVSTATTIMGQPSTLPLMLSPTGASRFYHPEGERAVARAAAAAGLVYGLSTMATTSLEDVATAAGPRMFQLYVFRDAGVTRSLVDRCRAAGYPALCLTVDAAVRGKRERELRSGMGVPMRLTPASLAQFALRPGWLAGQAMRGPLTMPNLAEAAGGGDLVSQTRFIGGQLTADVTWENAERWIADWNGPFAIKGILSPQDARRAVEIGATAVIVSNHGGRQLDGAASPFDMLADIAEAVDGRAEVILDGGVRRGAHMVKALARGATACAVGRPYLYGLACGGEAGVTRAIDILRDEFSRAMRLCGCTHPGEIKPGLLQDTASR